MGIGIDVARGTGGEDGIIEPDCAALADRTVGTVSTPNRSLKLT
jgi:hypothetical protein